jgi:hypothetical protein
MRRRDGADLRTGFIFVLRIAFAVVVGVGRGISAAGQGWCGSKEDSNGAQLAGGQDASTRRSRRRGSGVALVTPLREFHASCRIAMGLVHHRTAFIAPAAEASDAHIPDTLRVTNSVVVLLLPQSRI